MALRCFACRVRFTVAAIVFEQVNGVARVVPCPECGARPLAPATRHKIVQVARDTEEDHERVRVELRLGPEMYRRLAGWALPGSREAAYLMNSAWADGAYLLHVDAEALAQLAALADGSRCPEAIHSMRAAYLAAIGAE